MSPFIWLVIGWVIGVFTARILEPISHLLGTIWHLATRRSLDEHDSVSYVIHKQMKIFRVRQFFGASAINCWRPVPNLPTC